MTRHIERHFTAGAIVRDIVIGMSDGLTVPSLAAGLTGAISQTQLIVTADRRLAVRSRPFLGKPMNPP